MRLLLLLLIGGQIETVGESSADAPERVRAPERSSCASSSAGSTSPFIRRKSTLLGSGAGNSGSSCNSPVSSPRTSRSMWASRRNRKEDPARKSPSPSILAALQSALYHSAAPSPGARSSSSNASPVSTLTGQSPAFN